ncbi:MAG: hypothetical protein ABIK44_05765 [candidate division WOR-3 bacterium]
MLESDVALLSRLGRRLFFTTDDLVKEFRLKPGSARVLASRLCAKGVFLRLKRGFYTLAQSWERNGRDDFFRIANILQVPSYISFLSALEFYGVTTQVPQSLVESAAIRRTVRFEVQGVVFGYYKLKPGLYGFFLRRNGVFIATPEKALVDALYLYSLGRYRIDFPALEPAKLDRRVLSRIGRAYPEKTRAILERVCGI